MNFYKEVENYFLLTRGNIFGISSHNLLSPREIREIKEWEEKNIPLKVIASGINESLQRFLDNYPDRRDEPPTLMYCRPTILKHWKLFKEMQTGKSFEKESVKPGKIKNRDIATLERIHNSISNIEKKNFLYDAESARTILDVLLKELMSKQTEYEDDEYDELFETGISKAVFQLSRTVTLNKKKEIVSDIIKEITGYSKSMSRDTYRHTRNTLYYDSIKDLFEL